MALSLVQEKISQPYRQNNIPSLPCHPAPCLKKKKVKTNIENRRTEVECVFKHETIYIHPANKHNSINPFYTYFKTLGLCFFQIKQKLKENPSYAETMYKREHLGEPTGEWTAIIIIPLLRIE